MYRKLNNKTLRQILKEILAVFLCLLMASSAFASSVTVHFSEDQSVTIRKEEGKNHSEAESTSESKQDAGYPEQDFYKTTGTVSVSVKASEGAFPAGTTMAVKDVKDEKTLSAIEGAVNSKISSIYAVEISFFDADGSEIKPMLPISVTMKAEEKIGNEDTVVVHVGNNGQAEPIPFTNVNVETVTEPVHTVASGNTDIVDITAKSPSSGSGIDREKKSFATVPDQSLRTQVIGSEDLLAQGELDIAPEGGSGVQFVTDQPLIYAIVGTVIEANVLTEDGHNFHITVTCGADSGIPEDAALDVKEILEGSELYEEYVLKTEDALGMEEGTAGYIRLFDISIVNKNDYNIKYQPAEGSKVDVKIELADSQSEELSVVHFLDENADGDVVESITESKDDSRIVSFAADGFSVYAVIGEDEPTARMKVNFHIVSYDENNQEVDTVITSAYVKKDDDEDALQLILYDPGVGELEAGETFRGWTFNKDYTVDEATSDFNSDFAAPYGAMTIEDVRDWAQVKQPDIYEGEDPEEIDLYAMILKHYTVTYLDRFGISLDTDSAYMLRNENVAHFTVNMVYETNDEDYHFKGWITSDEDKITNPSPVPANVTIKEATSEEEPITYEEKTYKLFTNNTKVTVSDDVVFRAHAPNGKWLVFHEVMKGATYTAPQFLEEGESPVMPNEDNMLLLGHTFAGWYKTYSETVDENTGEVTRTYSDPFEPGPILEKTNIYAKWEPAEWAPYTVVIWKQNLDGTYAYAESIELAGPVDSVVNTTGSTQINQNQTGNYVLSAVNNNDADYLVVNGHDIDNNRVQRDFRAAHTGRTGETHNYTNPDYIGFNCARIDQGVTINPEGNSVVNVYYDRITYTIKIYHARRSGNNYNVPTTRSNNNTLSLGGMNWTGTISSHQTGNTWSNGYQGPPAGVQTETSGNYTYYYTTITAKYGEDILDQWPKYEDYPNLDNDNNHGQFYTFVSWYMMNDAGGYRGNGSGLDTFKGVISKMDEKLLGDITTGNADANFLIGRYDNRTINIYTYQIWKEALLDDEGDPIIPAGKQSKVGTDGLTYYLDDSIQANSNAEPSGTQAPTYIGFKHVPGMDVKPALVNNRATIQFHYHRIANPIVYRDGSYFDGNGNRLNAYPPTGADQDSSPIAYETNLSSYNGGYNEQGVLVAGDDYKTDYPPSYPGFVFEGWYADASCTTPYTFTTMPDSSITVYAKFRQIQYRVFLHPNVPEGKIVYWGSEGQEMNFRANYGATISSPTAVLIAAEGEPDVLDESYEFAGWYRDPQLKQPFDADAYVLNDDLASPYDKTVDMTDEMDEYGNIISNPGYNSDLTGNNGGDRWWIDKKIDLYGKWVKKLEEGTGIQVIYDPNGGSDEVEDTYLYKDGTNAIAQSAPVTPPTVTVDGKTVDKVFLYWVLQEWNPEGGEDGQGAFEDIAPLDFVYPGDSFGVNFDHARTVQTTDPETGKVTTQYFVQLRAEYTEPGLETPTHIWWYSNFGENEVIKLNDTDDATDVEDVKINEAAFIKPKGTFTRPGYEFLGWARVESTDANGNPLDGHPALHPELDEDDLFLKYVEAASGVSAHFEAQDRNGAWVPVTQVAADENTPYHDLYAVWKKNSYTVTVKKVVSSDVQSDYTKDFTFTPDFSDESISTAVFTLKDYATNSNVTKVYEDVPYGTTFSFTEQDVDNYNVAVTYTVTDADDETKNVTDATSSNGAELTVDGNVTVTFTNTRKTTTVNVDKVLAEDTGANGTKKFPFSWSVTEVTGKSGSFTLAADEAPMTLASLPVGATLVIEETEHENYTVSVKVGETPVVPGADGKYSVTIVEGMTITFTNTRNKHDLDISKILNDPFSDAPTSFNYTVTVKDGETEFTDIRGLTDGKVDVTANGDPSTLRGIPAGATVTITENDAANYTVTAEDSKDATLPVTGNAMTTFTMPDEDDYGVTFTNDRKLGSLKITKDAMYGTTEIGDGKEYQITVHSATLGYLQSVPVGSATPAFAAAAPATPITVTANTADGITINNLPIGAYTVTELIGITEGDTSLVDISGYRYDGTIYNPTNRSAEVTKNNTVNNPAAVTITNNYTKLVDVTVTKVLKDIEGMPLQTFTFTPVLSNDGTHSLADYEHGVTLTDEGKFSLTPVKDEETGLATASVTFHNLPAGAVFTVTEDADENFKTTYTPNDGSVTLSETEANEITVTNVRKTGSLTVKKAAVDQANRNISREAPFKFTLKLGDKYVHQNKEGDVTTTSLVDAETDATKFEVTANDADGSTVYGLPYGEYTVAEVFGTDNAEVQIENYVYDGTTYSEDTTDKTNVTAAAAGEVTITNKYTHLVPVTVTKVLVDNEGAKESFTFTASLKSGTGETATDITEDYLGEKDEGAAGKSYIVEVEAGKTAEDNKGNVIPDDIKVPVGSVLTVTETVNSSYKTEVSVAGAAATESLTGTLTVTDSDTTNTILFTNTRKQQLISIWKTDTDHNSLTGASFALYSKEDYDAHGTDATPIELRDGNTVGSNGILKLGDLPLGTYSLVETQAPAGYNPADSAITIIVNSTGVTATQSSAPAEVERKGDTHWVQGQDDDTWQIRVWNNPGVSLPSTGGIGTMAFTAGGILLIMLALFLLLKKRRAMKE